MKTKFIPKVIAIRTLNSAMLDYKVEEYTLVGGHFDSPVILTSSEVRDAVLDLIAQAPETTTVTYDAEAMTLLFDNSVSLRFTPVFA